MYQRQLCVYVVLLHLASQVFFEEGSYLHLHLAKRKKSRPDEVRQERDTPSSECVFTVDSFVGETYVLKRRWTQEQENE